MHGAEVEPDGERCHVPGDDGSGRGAALGFQDAELADGGGHAGLVAEPFADVEGALVLPGGLVAVAGLVGENAGWVVAAGHADWAAKRFAIVGAALVWRGGLVVVPAFLGEMPRLW